MPINPNGRPESFTEAIGLVVTSLHKSKLYTQFLVMPEALSLDMDKRHELPSHNSPSNEMFRPLDKHMKKLIPWIANEAKVLKAEHCVVVISSDTQIVGVLQMEVTEQIITSTFIWVHDSHVQANPNHINSDNLVEYTVSKALKKIFRVIMGYHMEAPPWSRLQNIPPEKFEKLKEAGYRWYSSAATESRKRGPLRKFDGEDQQGWCRKETDRRSKHQQCPAQ